MKYFVTNQYGKTTIQDWATDMSSNSKFKALTQEQLSYLESHPTASAYDVQNLVEHVEPEPQVIDLDSIKESAIKEISEYSLKTMDRYCTTYQYANADASLRVPDGEGIYSHNEASEIMNTYLRIGKACREEYYSAKNDIMNATTVEEVVQIKAATYEYYDTLS